ncbi:ComEA family DNA-binding protein [Campylobacter curvus]|uniref:ComEA family DNA-binding protein n=1 Tax=Campylobacter curvus TaxID=200 RepID=UPI0014703496|nr:helix-hairpin-helix domain-containing protein [Campylobacter curvus]
MKFSRILLALACGINFTLASVDINKADKKELIELGFNKSQAMNIIKYRKAHPFKSTDELTKVKGVNFSQVQKIKDKISVAKAKKPTKPKAKK